jgi:hypothetical protein
MAPQLLTAQDEENYGPELLDMSKRAALEALAPELQRLHADNQVLRQMAARSQNANIQQELDRALPDWHAVYQNPRFSSRLSEVDPYNGTIRSQLLRQAVAAGDAHRVVRFYQGFLGEVGRTPSGQSRAAQSRQPASGGPRVYSREDIRRFYEQRRLGHISDARWAQIEPAIIKAANDGRIAGALDRDGNKLTELR